MRRWADDVISGEELRRRIERRAAYRNNKAVAAAVGIIIGALVMALPWLTMLTHHN